MKNLTFEDAVINNNIHELYKNIKSGTECYCKLGENLDIIELRIEGITNNLVHYRRFDDDIGDNWPVHTAHKSEIWIIEEVIW